MLEKYDVKKVIGCLKTTTDFNTLFHNLFRQLEEAYPVDLHTYDNVIFNADKYLDSFKSISGTSKKIVQNTRSCLLYTSLGNRLIKTNERFGYYFK